MPESGVKIEWDCEIEGNDEKASPMYEDQEVREIYGAVPKGEIIIEQGWKNSEAGKHNTLASSVAEFYSQGLRAGVLVGQVQTEVSPSPRLQNPTCSIGDCQRCEGTITVLPSKSCTAAL